MVCYRWNKCVTKELEIIFFKVNVAVNDFEFTFTNDFFYLWSVDDIL